MPRASCTRRPGDTASRRRGRGTPIARTLLPAVRRPPSPGEEPRSSRLPHLPRCNRAPPPRGTRATTGASPAASATPGWPRRRPQSAGRCAGRRRSQTSSWLWQDPGLPGHASASPGASQAIAGASPGAAAKSTPPSAAAMCRSVRTTSARPVANATRAHGISSKSSLLPRPLFDILHTR